VTFATHEPDQTWDMHGWTGRPWPIAGGEDDDDDDDDDDDVRYDDRGEDDDNLSNQNPDSDD
jgi:hypothetical protein